MKKNVLKTIACAGGIVLCSGCALNVEKMPIDHTAFANPRVEKIREAESATPDTFPRLVVVPQDENKLLKNHNEELLGTYLDTKFTSLPGFVVVPRAELGALNTENILTNVAEASESTAKVIKADYLITYQFVSAKTESRDEEKYAGSGNYRTVTYYTNRFKGRISVLEIATGKRSFTQIYEVVIPTGNRQTEDWDKAAEMLAEKIIWDFYSRYGLPVYVKETRGNGRVALLSENFLTKTLPEGTKIRFHGEKTTTGKVFSGRWVEVDDYESSGVCKNQLVTIERPE